MRRGFALLCLLTGGAGALPGQSGRSSILGTVTDASGAAVPNIAITVTNTGTGLRRQTVTNEQGNYEVTALDVGVYQVLAEPAAGFRRAVVEGIQLQVDQRARVDIRLELGEVTQQINVEANPVAVQTDDATLSTVIDSAIYLGRAGRPLKYAL